MQGYMFAVLIQQALIKLDATTISELGIFLHQQTWLVSIDKYVENRAIISISRGRRTTTLPAISQSRISHFIDLNIIVAHSEPDVDDLDSSGLYGACLPNATAFPADIITPLTRWISMDRNQQMTDPHCLQCDAARVDGFAQIVAALLLNRYSLSGCQLWY